MLRNKFQQSSQLVHGPKLYESKDWMWHKFINDFGLTEDWHSPSGYYGVCIDKQGNAWLWTKPGFRWDGASLYPDYDFMKNPSRIHDCLHWMIKWGVLSELQNDLIDKELGDCVRYGKTPIDWYLGGELSRPLRAKMVERATHVVNEKRSDRELFEMRTIPI